MSALAWSAQTRRLAIPPRLGFGRAFFCGRRVAHLLKILHRQTELCQDFFVRNAFVVFQPRIGIVDGAELLSQNGKLPTECYPLKVAN